MCGSGVTGRVGPALNLLVNQRNVFGSGGRINYRAIRTLAHEMGHFFGICSGTSSECQNRHTEVHIPDIMVWDGTYATNVRNQGIFYKFLTSCAEVYKDLLCAKAQSLPASCAVPRTCDGAEASGLSCAPSGPPAPSPPRA